MKISSVVATLALGAGIIGTSAFATDGQLRFDGGIGVDPVAGIANNLPVLNTVFGVAPGGRPWVIERLRVDIKADGRISARGEGLLLAGSDAIGTVGAIQQVAATLFCGGQPLSSGGFPLNANGDFQIDGMLNGQPPNPCDNPVLLIRNAPAGVPGAWFAAGIPKN